MQKTLRAIVLLALVLTLSASCLAETYYVYTANGKTLNLRSEVDNKVIANIPYGTALEPDEEKSTERAAYVTYKDKSGFVKWAYLVKDRPAAHVRTAAAPTMAPAPAALSMQATQSAPIVSAGLFSNFRQSNGTVIVSTGDRMFWTPDSSGSPIIAYAAGTELERLAEDGNWCQVFDPEKRLCGFMPRASLTDKAP